MSATVPEPITGHVDTDTYDAYRGFCAAIGVAPDAAARQNACAARDEFVARRITVMRDAIDRGKQVSPDRAREIWLASVTEAVSRFRFAFAVPLSTHEVADGGEPPLDRGSVRRAVECMRQSRWEEGYKVVQALAGWPRLSPACRARLLTICGQIELWRLSRPEQALPLFEEASALSPDDGWIASAVGDYWQYQGDVERARGHFARSRALSPDDCNGYVSEGEGHESAGEFDEAERWYRRAIAEAPGESLGYDRLIRVLARKETLSAREQEVLALRDLRNAIDPEGAYDAALNLADFYIAATRYADAERCLELAAEAHPDWPRAFVRRADVARDQGRLLDAVSWCRRAIAVAPDSQDAHIVLARLFEQQRDWAEALATYQQVPEEPRLLAGEAKASAGRMLMELDRLEEAEQVLLDDMRAWPTDPAAVAHVATLVDKYAARDDLAAVTRVLDAVLHARGEGYRTTYHNLLGNVYYVRDDNARAASEYRAAIAASAPDAVLYRNLAGALADHGEYQAALAALETAFSIDHDEPKHVVRKAKVANARGRGHYDRAEYEDAIRAFTLATELHPAEPVYLQNLARAYELAERPGERVEAWRRALACYERSLAIPGAPSQDNVMARLRAQIDVAQQFGVCTASRPSSWMSAATSSNLSKGLVEHCRPTCPRKWSDSGRTWSSDGECHSQAFESGATPTWRRSDVS
jgi:tetratricopeptide (TPR) repeat protein